VLDALGVPASMFVCPSVIDTERPLWFQSVDIAIAAGVVPRLAGRPVTPDVFLRQLKRVPDPERRSLVECLEDEVVAVTGRPLHREQLTTSELRRWVAAGHEVGNHTWDHPCLPRCSDEQQTAQITRADDWLSGALPDYVPTFAYPNGDWSATAQRALEARGHALAVLFDHRLAGDAAGAPLRLSRLRLSADAELPRTRAIVSGAHSAASALLRSSA
jgi:peptidoglycan/xylan/chitin deacetylase (PgdA/CDA1 family)